MSLKFDNGIVGHEAHNGTLYFNPTDSALLLRIYDAMDELSAKQSEREQRVASAADADALDVLRGIETEVRNAIDSAVGPGTCDVGFLPGMSVLSYSDGLPLWQLFLLGMLDIFYNALDKNDEAKGNERLAQYVAKYKRRQR